MLAVAKIENGLAHQIGTVNYWKNKALCFQYTDGIKFLWESCEAYWLLILISSYRRKERFQVWELKKIEGTNKAVVTMKEDTDCPILVEQEIPYTDFPLDEIKLYLIDGILLLPSEY